MKFFPMNCKINKIKKKQIYRILYHLFGANYHWFIDYQWMNNRNVVIIKVNYKRVWEDLMTANSEQAIKNLQEAIKKDDHNEVYEYSKILLKQFPDDEEYQQCLIISSMKINVLDDLEILFKNPPTKDSLKPLYVYYLYFIGEYEKTISYLEGLMQKSSDSSYKILLAQSYFKLNDQASSAKIMLELLKDSNKLEREDLQFYLVNLFATSVNQSFDEPLISKYRNIAKEKYAKEVYYNFALLLVSLADYRSALQFLGEFQKNLKKPEDENQIKMTRVLRDFINFKTSNKIHLSMDVEQKELKIAEYEKMEEQVNQINLKSTIKNNKIFLKYQNGASILENFHEILKAIDQGLQKKSKTTKPQQFVLKLNKFTILLKKNRLTQAAKILKDLQNNFETELYLNNNLNFIKGKYFLLKKISRESSKESSDLFGFLTSLSKLHANLAFCLMADLKRQEDQEKQLISQLRQQTCHSSIIKNFVFSLLIKNPEMFQIYHEYLAELLEKTTDFKILGILLKLYENKQDLTKQEAILNKILEINSKDFNAKVKLAEIFISKNKFEEAEELLRGVEEPEEINDINYLQHIQKNIHVSVKKDDQIQTTLPPKKGEEKQVVANQQAKKRIKKKRRPRYPKNMQKLVEGFKGDPERWLPKWQRKGYKKKGKKGAGKTQGLATVGKQETKNVYTTNASTSAKQVTKQAVKKRK